MKEEQFHKKLSQKYTYQKSSPQYKSDDGNYKVYSASHKDLAIPLTIKILNGFDQNIVRYLNKLKDIKSQQNIKIYEVIADNYLAFVTERVVFSNLSNALKRSKKLDDQDALFMCKYLLQGHMQVLRSGIQWFGTLEDIQLTENGVKLSWNNGRMLTQQNVFPQILQIIGGLKTEGQDSKNSLLPFPPSKQVNQLIKLSQTTASEISLHPLMKKKQKYIHKRVKDYLLIKQSKNSFDFYQQTVYLGVSQQNGLCRIKMYQNGKVQEKLLDLNRNKNTFTKVFQSFVDNNKYYIVSEYSNNGNLQNYVNRLKNAGVQLKQEHIQFFFYSLFQPLKLIQQSNIKSLNMLHIKNIYLENGIPKIGEPVPLNAQIEDRLIQRADVPDFFHRGFKRQPKSHDPTYDTYSLGVLLYKLMYTQYPIFPNSKVHIPTTPSYNSRLKKTLQLFLNQGGILSDIQKKIEVSQSVINQVKQNKIRLLNDKKQLLKVQMKKNKKKRHLEDEDMQKQDQAKVSQKTGKNQDEQQQNGDDICCDCFSLQYQHNTTIDPQVQSLHNSPYRFYRVCTKFIIMVLFYVLLFYMFYISSNFSMVFNTASLTKHNVTISTVNYQIIITDVAEFQKSFNTTSKTLTSLKNMGCYINNYNGSADYGDLADSSNIFWMLYLISGFVIFVIIIIFKSILVFKFDMMKVKHNIQANISNFNMSNYIIINLLIAALINHHYYFYSTIFDEKITICLGDKHGASFSYAWYMFNYPSTFLIVHLPVFSAFFLIVFFSLLMVYKTDTIKYSKLFNPIILFGPFLLGYYIVVRIGVVSKYFYPSALSDSQSIITNFFIDGDYIGVLGIVPQMMLIAQLIFNWIVDLMYWGFIDKRRRILINESSTQNIQIYQ